MFLEKKEEFLHGKIEKRKYMEEMFQTHKHLFEYPTLLKNSPVQKNEITNKEGVVFHINSVGNIIKICCDEKDAHSLPMSFLNFGEYESAEYNMIFRLIKSGDVVFDIGANLGWYTINILLKKQKTKVYSFEPIKSSYLYLKKNLELNGQDVSSVYNFGLSDKNKKVKFYYDVECSAASSMADLREGDKTIIETCETKKLDDIAPSKIKLNKLDFIKCDVEGSELFVYKGAIKTIEKYKPIIFSEMLRKWSKKFGYHPNDIIELFRSINYECYIIDNNKIEKFGYVDDNTTQTNYLFFHKEKHAGIIKNLSVNKINKSKRN